MIILIHSSKTMKPKASGEGHLRAPELLEKTRQLDSYLKTLSIGQIAKAMHLSESLAAKTSELIASWTDEPGRQCPAINTFLGDIYSGLQASEFSNDELKYADKSLRILSGLYGVVKPLDGIYPYRLEMGYRLPEARYRNLYDFWGDSIAKTLPTEGLVINASSEEYTRAVLPHIDSKRVLTPRFFTKDPKTGEPKFVVVHSKIARGAYARWLIKNKAANREDLLGFNDLNYAYNKHLSLPNSPAFVCESFGGLGMSVRLR